VLLETPAALRWVSAEPLLAPISLGHIEPPAWEGDAHLDPLWGALFCERRNEPADYTRLDWVVVGGQSGPGRRTMEIPWLAGIVEQCWAAGVPV
jgi:protein gp37